MYFSHPKPPLKERNVSRIESPGLQRLRSQHWQNYLQEECGPDSSFSILPSQPSALRLNCHEAHSAVRANQLNKAPKEKKSRRLRSSIYLPKDLKKREKIRDDQIHRTRPGYGIGPKYYDELVGRAVTQDVERGQAVTFDLVIDNS